MAFTQKKQQVVSEQIAIQSSSSGQSSIKLVFEKTADRWGHRWSSVSAGVEHPFLTSVEGTPDQNWPPSPPLQEISQHTLEPGDAALGVGMAGQSHWSASYSVESSVQPGQPNLIKSDLACLQKGASSEPAESHSIGSTFEVHPACKVLSSTKDRIELLPTAGRVIVLAAISGDDFETEFELTDRTLRVGPCHVSNSPVVATRWGFEVQVAS
jgi:hypothetical protein